MAGGGQAGQGLAGLGHAERRVAPAPDQLQGLHQELDLADAAPTELDVVAGKRDRLAAAIGVDLPLDRMDILDRREVEMPAPDERPDPPQEPVARRLVASRRPGPDHGRALPVLADTAIVGFGAGDRDGQRRGPRVRPQAQIGAEHETVAGAVPQDGDEVLGQADKTALHAVAPGVEDSFVVVQNDKVYVAGIIEFAGPELAHGEDDEAAVALRLVGRVRGDEAVGGGLAQQMSDRVPEYHVGEVAQGAGRPLERPCPRKVRQGHGEGDPASGDSQLPHDLAPPGIQRKRPAQVGEHRREYRVGALLEETDGERRIRQHALGEERAVAEYAFQKRAASRVLDQRGPEIGDPDRLGPRHRLAPTLQAQPGAALVADPGQAAGRRGGIGVGLEEQLHARSPRRVAQCVNPTCRSRRREGA